MQFCAGLRRLQPPAYLVLAMAVGFLATAVRAPADEAPEASPSEAAAEPAEKVAGEKPAEEESAKEDSAEEPSVGEGPAVAKPPQEKTIGQESEAPKEPGGGLKIDSPRELLRQLGIDDSRFDRFVDGRPPHVDEEETLLRILYRLRDISLEQIDEWIHDRLDMAMLVQERDALRVDIFPIRGRLVRVDVARPVPEVVERFEMPAYYRCEIELEGSDQRVTVFTRIVPDAWREGGPMDHRAGAEGFFLKLGSDDPEHPQPVFAARRVAWYPETPLGELGFDIGLLDDMKDKEPLRQEEREAFYQLLHAVGQTAPGQLRQEADRQLHDLEAAAQGDPKRIAEEIETDTNSNSVIPLFMDAPQRRGRLVVVTGEARKIVLVRVDDPDIRRRFGIDHYYEMSIFTPDSQGNPLVFCVLELPEGLSPGEGPQYSETVRVAGFFMKLWAYRVPPPPGTPEEKRESTLWTKRAPLLVGRAPLWYPREAAPSATWFGAIAGALFLIALAATWIAIWRYNRADRAFHQKTIARNFSADSGVSLDQIGLDADGKPDFSMLEDTDPSEGNGKQPG